MQRLAQFDVSKQFITRRGQVAAQYIFGIVCAGAMLGLRTIFDAVAPTSGPFALIYPTVLLATFYGRLRAGLTALVITFGWAWYMVLPAQHSFTFLDPTDPARVAINAACCLVVIVFAEAFRRAASSTMDEIQKAADRRLTLLAELEHRTKNNFSLVASLLEFQKRRAIDPAIRDQLDDAVGRVRTFADAYSNLELERSGDKEVSTSHYLGGLLDRIEQAAVPPNVKLFREIEEAMLPRETAVAIGLYLNEAVSNCLKYAFPVGRNGTIGVYFHVRDDDWRLCVEDDGVGMTAKAEAGGGLGTSLMEAFARQARASHEAIPMDRGFRTTISNAEREWQPTG